MNRPQIPPVNPETGRRNQAEFPSEVIGGTFRVDPEAGREMLQKATSPKLVQIILVPGVLLTGKTARPKVDFHFIPREKERRFRGRKFIGFHDRGKEANLSSLEVQ